MPWRLIGFIVLLVLVGIFSNLNLDNRCDISLGFVVLEEVPIFISLLVAFLAGALVIFPFTIAPAIRRRDRREPRDKRAKKRGPKRAELPPPAPMEFDVEEPMAEQPKIK